MRMMICVGLGFLCLFHSAKAAAQPSLAPGPPAGENAMPAASAALQKTLGDFLQPAERPEGPDADSPYATIPPELEQAVRYISMDNFTSAVAELEPLAASANDDDQRARASMWLGINYGLQAYYFPDDGPELATSVTTLLRGALHHGDEEMAKAPDVMRLLAEMVGHGWSSKDPAAELQQAEQRAENSRLAMDFYYAGVISRRLSARAWAHSNTTEQDHKTLSLFAKAVARDPNHYESWSAYLPALLPVGMHDLATTEAARMYQHFRNLRAPLLGDQGPAVLMMTNSSYRTMKDDEDLLAEIARQWPDSPMPPFELAMRAIESTPTLAMELFPKLIERFENGSLKPLPREAGYYPSALYKWAFLLQNADRLRESLEVYRKVKNLSPDYAEVNLNIAIVLAQLSDKEQDPAMKVALLGEALQHARQQKNYRGKAAQKVEVLSGKISEAIATLKKAANPIGR